MGIMDEPQKAAEKKGDRRIKENGLPEIQGMGRGEINTIDLSINRIRMDWNF